MPETIAQVWSEITTWFESNNIAEFSSIQAPEALGELENLFSTIGKGSAKELMELYGLMDGVDPNVGGIGLYPAQDEFDAPYEPLSIEQICSDWKMHKELLESGDFDDCQPESCHPQIKNDFWNTSWIPFAWNGGGDYYCIDLDPSASGNHGQVITHCHETGDHRLLADSLTSYLKSIVEQLENEQLVFEEDGLVPN